MLRNIDRIRADNELRLLNVMLAATCAAQGSADALKDVRQGLIAQVGITQVMAAERSSREDILKFMKKG